MGEVVSGLRVTKLDIPEVLLIESARYPDERGWFSVTYNQKSYSEAGLPPFCQENHSMSRAVGTVRGLHYQKSPKSQAKLVHVLSGRIVDVAVDMRKGSPTFGRHVAVELSAENGRQLFVPRGFAHGYMTHVPDTVVGYKVDNDYAVDLEGGIAWNDPDLGIDWGGTSDAIVISHKDQILPRLAQIDSPFAIASLTS
jgi:dTDP-4-dehydrorhamnose 3,5-epimerase